MSGGIISLVANGATDVYLVEREVDQLILHDRDFELVDGGTVVGMPHHHDEDHHLGV